VDVAADEDIVAVSNTPEDIAARDDTSLRSLGIHMPINIQAPHGAGSCS
jgi:hypothetical protein